MENKDRLDEFLQRKFAEDDPGYRFAFREEHWLQAQALIEAAERRRRRRGLWWWLAGGLGAVLFGWWAAANGALLFHWTDQLAVVAPASPDQRPLAPAFPSARIETGERNPDVQAPAKTASGGSDAASGYSSRSNPAPVRSNMEKRPLKEVFLPAEPIAGAKTTRPASGLPEPAQPAPAAEMPVPTGMLAKPTQMKTSVAPEDAAKTLSPTRAPELLPLPLRILPRTPPAPALQAPVKPPVAETERHREWRLQAGIAAVGASKSGVLNDEKPGVAGGLTARLQRKGSPWAFNADLLWRWRRGWALPHTPTPTETVQLRYGFGYTLDQIQLEMTGGHWLELPLAVQYRWRNFRPEAGVSPTLTVLAYGKEKRYHQESLAPGTRTASRAVRLSNRYFTQLGLGLFAGLEWAASTQLGLGLRLYYQPGSLLQAPVDQPVPAARPLWGDLRLRWFLFNAK